jgi:hypothetical protein
LLSSYRVVAARVRAVLVLFTPARRTPDFLSLVVRVRVFLACVFTRCRAGFFFSVAFRTAANGAGRAWRA